mmetsp:Transcript_167102/g.536672  ORF Transcript_167102/g.536672 Transcript_167102/m.536672 type:complete len:314 (-) Transcript_167102:1047-1988(-)
MGRQLRKSARAIERPPFLHLLFHSTLPACVVPRATQMRLPRPPSIQPACVATLDLKGHALPVVVATRSAAVRILDVAEEGLTLRWRASWLHLLGARHAAVQALHHVVERARCSRGLLGRRPVHHGGLLALASRPHGPQPDGVLRVRPQAANGVHLHTRGHLEAVVLDRVLHRAGIHAESVRLGRRSSGLRPPLQGERPRLRPHDAQLLRPSRGRAVGASAAAARGILRASLVVQALVHVAAAVTQLDRPEDVGLPEVEGQHILRQREAVPIDGLVEVHAADRQVGGGSDVVAAGAVVREGPGLTGAAAYELEH